MNHRNAWNMIPWFVNGRASGREREVLELHLAECADCRAEVDAQRGLMHAMQTTPVVESMPHASLQKLWQRIEADPAASAPQPAPPARQPRLLCWLAAAAAFEALLLGGLSTLLYQARSDSPAAEYRTVSSAPAVPETAGVRAVFSPSLTLGELQALLSQARLRIDGGPSEDGVYTLVPTSTDDDLRTALQVLRAHPASRFAEPVGP